MPVCRYRGRGWAFNAATSLMTVAATGILRLRDQIVKSVQILDKDDMKRIFPVLVIVFFLFQDPGYAQVVIENHDLRLVLGNNGHAESLIHKATGQECLAAGVDLPAFTVKQYRPYDNETQLTYVTRPTVFPANAVTRQGDTLRVGFEHLDYIAVISVKTGDHYIAFQPEYFIKKEKKLGVKAETRVDEMTFLQLPVKDREHFGSWLNVSWDGQVAVNLLGTDVHTRVDDVTGKGYHILRAATVKDIRLTGTGAALIVTSADRLLDDVAQVEKDYHLPPGVANRRDPKYAWSYYECRDVNPGNIDEHIRYARMGGFRMMVIYYPSFARSMGHFPWRREYPGGMEDLKYVTKKIRDAGMIPGFHIHYNKAQINDPYVTPVPDPRLNLRKIFTLAGAVDDKATVIPVEENPQGITLFEGRRLLKIGDEIIEYTGYTDQQPYRFTGCKRGVLHTKAAAYGKGYKFGLMDVDNWPIFIRFDQRTSIQDEVAEKIADFVKEAGFRFIYFDGAEDVNRPYWYNVSLSMERVYDKLDPQPFFSEGACKAHFNWHILSRGNAFDTFKPEEIKEAVDKRHLGAAAYNADNFTCVDFGWIGYTPPGEGTIGIQPDMIAYIASHAAGWDSPLSLVGDLGNLGSHPRTPDNLAVLKRWQEAGRAGFFTDEQKTELKKAGKEFVLLKDGQGNFELHECRRIKNIAGNDPHIRAFIFRKKDHTWVEYWHTSGESSLILKTSLSHVRLYDGAGKKVKIKKSTDGILIPAGGIRYLDVDLPEKEVEELFKKAIVQDN